MQTSAGSTTPARTIDEAMTAVETTKERMVEAEIIRVGGEVALRLPKRMQRKQKHISSARFRSRINNKPNPGNSAPQ